MERFDLLNVTFWPVNFLMIENCDFMDNGYWRAWTFFNGGMKWKCQNVWIIDPYTSTFFISDRLSCDLTQQQKYVTKLQKKNYLPLEDCSNFDYVSKWKTLFLARESRSKSDSREFYNFVLIISVYTWTHLNFSQPRAIFGVNTEGKSFFGPLIFHEDNNKSIVWYFWFFI